MSDFMCSNGCGNDVEYAACHACAQRETEATYKRGFDAGIEFQKTANPPPKARELKQRLVELAFAARGYIEAQSSDAVHVRTAARERLLAALEVR